MSLAPGAEPADVIPAGFSARTQVHEYGGRCYAVHGDTVVFSNWDDQRLWRPPARPATPAADPRARRASRRPLRRPGHHPRRPVGDLRPRAPRPRRPGGQRPGRRGPRSARPGRPAPRCWPSGHDFYAAPRLSPDGLPPGLDHLGPPRHAVGRHRAVGRRPRPGGADLGAPPARLAGGRPRKSVTQPRWSPAGVLHYVSDRTRLVESLRRDRRGAVPPRCRVRRAGLGVRQQPATGSRPMGGWSPPGRSAAAQPARVWSRTGGPEPLDVPFFHLSATCSPPRDGGDRHRRLAHHAPRRGPPRPATARVDGAAPQPGRAGRRGRHLDPRGRRASRPAAARSPTPWSTPPANADFVGPGRRATSADRDDPRRPDLQHRAGVQPGRAVLDQPRASPSPTSTTAAAPATAPPTGAGWTARGASSTSRTAPTSSAGWQPRAGWTAAGR